MLDTVTSTLVSSKDVTGTNVYSTSTGDHVGEIDHLVIDKESGRVAYAVMNFGGFLGIGEETHPLPWGTLSYSKDHNGFVTNVTKEQLEGAPARSDDWHQDRVWEQRFHDHYLLPYYWI